MAVNGSAPNKSLLIKVLNKYPLDKTLPRDNAWLGKEAVHQATFAQQQQQQQKQVENQKKK